MEHRLDPSLAMVGRALRQMTRRALDHRHLVVPELRDVWTVPARISLKALDNKPHASLELRHVLRLVVRPIAIIINAHFALSLRRCCERAELRTRRNNIGPARAPASSRFALAFSHFGGDAFAQCGVWMSENVIHTADCAGLVPENFECRMFLRSLDVSCDIAQILEHDNIDHDDAPTPSSL
jgi:hypothetical protein